MGGADRQPQSISAVSGQRHLLVLAELVGDRLQNINMTGEDVWLRQTCLTPLWWKSSRHKLVGAVWPRLQATLDTGQNLVAARHDG